MKERLPKFNPDQPSDMSKVYGDRPKPVKKRDCSSNNPLSTPNKQDYRVSDKLPSICVWCPADTRPILPPGIEFSSGICENCKETLLNNYYAKKVLKTVLDTTLEPIPDNQIIYFPAKK